MLSKRLNAAEGFLNLGMLDEAEAELVGLGAEAQDCAQFWRLGLAVAMAQRRWEEGIIRAEVLVTLCPEAADGYLHLAFCLHELGQTSEARKVLLSGPPPLRGTPIYFYNLACYEAQLGNVERARELLEVALQLDPGYREVAKTDPDLAPLR